MATACRDECSKAQRYQDYQEVGQLGTVRAGVSVHAQNIVAVHCMCKPSLAASCVGRQLLLPLEGATKQSMQDTSKSSSLQVQFRYPMHQDQDGHKIQVNFVAYRYQHPYRLVSDQGCRISFLYTLLPFFGLFPLRKMVCVCVFLK